ncbi:phenylalanine--tRNA ligase subunit beta [Tepidibacillus marianensis]|uniref:phenylalanine--tRNA ligase subunit beta n=1 Tax=Tepidibacillus marianensis TaxID=3131995 RepID=UPI0030CE26D4
MKVSYQWLSDYVEIENMNPYELAEKLTRSGVTVDIIEKVNPDLVKVVVGHVLETTKHPEATKLNICKVDVGQEEALQIVCGAANVAAGQKVPVALVGSKLPGNVKIKKAKLRGVESQGMICSSQELGMTERYLSKEKTEGILVLQEDAPLGQPIEGVLGFNDYVLELDLTPNRADCLSMLGVAYEVAAILDRPLKLPEVPLDEVIADHPSVSIEIEAPNECHHYAARLVKNISVGESPQWLQNRLIASGIRPINNVVDITNFVMLEYGQPLHAFDFEQLMEPKIVVRLAKPGEKMVTLDDQERTLDEEMLLITDGTKPIAIAGVMGGANSEVTEQTTEVLLESAYFSGSSVRKTSKKLGLRSEASMRFEKGVDPNRIYSAVNRAASLLEELSGGTVEGDIYEAKITISEKIHIHVRTHWVNKVLGTQISNAEMKHIFERLQFSAAEIEDGFMVTVPTRRQDITQEVDLIEEIARIYGYDEIPTTMPSGRYSQGGLKPSQKLRRSIKNQLEAMGLQEVITYTFTSEQQLKLNQGLADGTKPIALALPMSEERQFLRTDLLPHLLEVAEYNANRNQSNIRIYEIGTVFTTDELQITTLPKEKQVLAGIVTGQVPTHWQNSNETYDFYYVKGIVEQILSGLGITDIQVEHIMIKGYHPGRTAVFKKDERILGYVGEIHPEVQQQYDLQRIYGFELDLSVLFTLANTHIEYHPLPKYPAIQRDLAVVISKDITAQYLMNIIQTTAGTWLESVTLFDIYMSEKLGEDKKSMAFSLVYRNPERTLTDDEIATMQERVIQALRENASAELR